MTDPYWLEEPILDRPRPRLDGRAEVEIVGGGVTGLSCALTLALADVHVRLHEARELASGASGRNGGFALRGGSMAYPDAIEQLGRERARVLWALTERGLDRMEALAGDAFRRTGSLRVAADDAELVEIERELEELTRDGFAAERVDALPDALAGFAGAFRHVGDGALQPARWVRRLGMLAAEAGAELVEHSRVGSLAELEAPVVVLATDGYTGGLLPALDAVVGPVRNQVVVTEPLAALRFGCPHYARHGFDYWQQLPDRRLVVGGRRDVDPERELTADESLTPAIQASLEELATRLAGEPVEITHRWAGIFGSSPDGLPLAGQAPGEEGVWVAAGYAGHGNVLGLVCGELVARAILDEPAPELELFDPARCL